MKKKYLIFISYFLPTLLFAKEGGGKIEVPFKNFNDMTLEGFLAMLIKGITYISIPILVLAFIYAGFSFVKAQGDPNELSKAKKIFLATSVAALIILGSNVILTLVSNTADAILK